jgi:hypothetical protein
MNAKIKKLKYVVEVESPYDYLNNVCETLCTLPMVNDVTLVGSDVQLKDFAGTLKRGLDGLQYQREQRGE